MFASKLSQINGLICPTCPGVVGIGQNYYYRNYPYQAPQYVLGVGQVDGAWEDLTGALGKGWDSLKSKYLTEDAIKAQLNNQLQKAIANQAGPSSPPPAQYGPPPPPPSGGGSGGGGFGGIDTTTLLIAGGGVAALLVVMMLMRK